MAVEIRELDENSYPQIISLWRKAGLSHRPEGRDSQDGLVAQMETDPDLFLGAFIGNELIGTVFGTHDGRKGYINRLATDPDHRRQGTALALVRKCEAALRRRGAEVICLLIEVPNEASVSFFKSAGYVLHEDIIYMSKRDREES